MKTHEKNKTKQNKNELKKIIQKQKHNIIILKIRNWLVQTSDVNKLAK